MLLALVTQLATRLLSSRSNSSYVVDSSDTTCTYICCYLLFQNPTTLFSSRSSSNYVVDFCSTTCNYVVFFSIKFQLYTLLTFVTQLATTVLFFWSYWYYWCSMVYIKELLSQQFVLPKPRFTVARKILAMEVHKPQCQLAAEDDWSIETHLLMIFFLQTPQKRSDENELLLW